MGETAKCSDSVLITPRELLDWNLAPGWTEEVEEYFGFDEFSWLQSHIFADHSTAHSRMGIWRMRG